MKSKLILLLSLVLAFNASAYDLLSSIKAPEDGTGDTFRIWKTIINANFTHLDGAAITSNSVALARGGTGSSLSDPGANVLWGWDDTDNAIVFWSLGSGLSYDHATHTISASGGGSGPALLNTVIWAPKWREATVHVDGDNYSKSWSQFATEYPPETAFDEISWASLNITSIANLNTLVNAQEILVGGNASLASDLDVSDLTELVTFNFNGSDPVANVDISGCTALQTLNGGGTAVTLGTLIGLSDCTALTSFAMQGCDMSGGLDLSFAPNLNYVQLNSCSLSQSEVNAVLVAVESFGTSGGTLIINNNAAPSGAGATAKTALEGRSWSVTSD